jgi:hypothetical protein
MTVGRLEPSKKLIRTTGQKRENRGLSPEGVFVIVQVMKLSN